VAHAVQPAPVLSMRLSHRPYGSEAASDSKGGHRRSVDGTCFDLESASALLQNARGIPAAGGYSAVLLINVIWTLIGGVRRAGCPAPAVWRRTLAQVQATPSRISIV
jgi:hypothetical protein